MNAAKIGSFSVTYENFGVKKAQRIRIIWKIENYITIIYSK